MEGKTCYEAALELSELGLSVIPLEPRGKKPLIKWTEYQERIATQEEIEQWFKHWPNANLGLVMGAISGLGAVDLDSQEAVDWFNTKAPAPMLYQTTGTGLHYLYKTNGRDLSNSASQLYDNIDVRGDGGYIVIAPSIHSNGNQYNLIYSDGFCGWDELPPFPYDLFADKNPFSPAEPNTPPVNKPLVNLNVVEGSRNSSLASYAGTLVNQGLVAEEVLRQLLVINADYLPPLNELEVRSIVNSIIKTDQKNEAKKPKPQMMPEFADLMQGKPFQLRDYAYSMTEELALYFKKQEPILGHWLKTGTMNMLHGASGAGKTWVTLGIAMSLATGKPFIPGWEACQKPMKVLMMDGEMDRSELRERKVNMAKGMNLPPQIDNLVTLSNLHLIEEKGFAIDLSDKDHRQAVEDYILAEKFKAVMLDNLSCLIPGVNIKLAEEYAPFNAWLIKMKGMGIIMIFIHHDHKGSEYNGTASMEYQLYARLHVKKGKREGQFRVDIPKLRGKSGGGDMNIEVVEDDNGGIVLSENINKVTALGSAVLFLESNEFASEGQLKEYLSEACGHKKSTIWKMLNSQKKARGKAKKILFDSSKGYFLQDE